MSTTSKPAKKKKPQKTVLVNVENTNYPSITRNVKKMGWKITENYEKTILFWYDNNVSVEVCLSLFPWQFINHIPGTYVIYRKVELARNMERIQKMFPKLYTFHPRSFAVPAQALDLQQYMSTASIKNRTFIIKPDLGAQGKGIYLIQDPDDVIDITETAIAQQYIPPHLLGGYKFDLRIYVLVSSVNPLRIYTFNEGMARFCTEPYQKPRPGNLDQVYRHLTNYSVNKKNEKFEQPTDTESNDGFKRSFTSVLQEMKEEGVDTEKLIKDMHQLIVLTIIGVHSYISHSVHTSFRVDDGKSRCFEIMGYDILIDKKNKPWLLEVNHSPSLQCDSPFDKQLKDSVISGAMKIMDLNPRFKKIVTEQEKIKTQQRITGRAKETQSKPNYDPNKETEIAKTTGWIQLYPVIGNDELQKIYDEVLKVESEMAPIGSDETMASRQRREAIQKKIEESEKKNQIPEKKKAVKPKKAVEEAPVTVQPKPLVSKTPRSVQLLREAKLARIRCDQIREQHMKSQDDLPDLGIQPPPSLQAYSRAVPHVTKPKIVPKNIIFDI